MPNNQIVFDERIALGLKATSSASDTLGPGRLSRCQRAAIRAYFRPDTTQGIIPVQYSHHQDFPGTPITIDTITWGGADKTHVVEILPKYLGGFVRLKPSTAVDGGGLDAWASGSR